MARHSVSLRSVGILYSRLNTAECYFPDTFSGRLSHQSIFHCASGRLLLSSADFKGGR